MCGRYLLNTDAEYNELMNIVKDVEKNIQSKSGEVFPTDTAPVIIRDRLTFAKWGFYTYDSKLIINARSETIDTKPMFKKSFFLKRCLVPANFYFEWKKESPNKVKYKMGLSQRSLFFMAGLYSTFVGKDTDPFTGFVIITTSANETASQIHHRMPVILEPGSEKLWLDEKNQNLESLRKMLKPYSYDTMSCSTA